VKAVAKKKKPLPVVPKPKATEMMEGSDRLRRAMGLIEDKTTYLAIQVLPFATMFGYRY
jgi:hypothetical protein